MIAAAMALVRAWTRAYTWRMPPECRARRRAEIESDLWECASAGEHAGAHLVLQIAGRLLRGIPHDLRWRIEQADRVERRLAGVVAFSATVVILGAAFFILPLMLPQTLPKPAPTGRPFIPAPPPPPPPPCRPAALGGCGR
jgi:hypothetical protein